MCKASPAINKIDPSESGKKSAEKLEKNLVHLIIQLREIGIPMTNILPFADSMQGEFVIFECTEEQFKKLKNLREKYFDEDTLNSFKFEAKK